MGRSDYSLVSEIRRREAQAGYVVILFIAPLIDK